MEVCIYIFYDCGGIVKKLIEYSEKEKIKIIIKRYVL